MMVFDTVKPDISSYFADRVQPSARTPGPTSTTEVWLFPAGWVSVVPKTEFRISSTSEYCFGLGQNLSPQHPSQFLNRL